jgi:DNA-binding MarR family transcriptional regulator
MHWTDRLHRHLIAITDMVNRFDVDARLLAASGVKLDRALYPLLSRMVIHPGLSAIELANIIGRDHSTVSRQVTKLEEQGLICREPSSRDRRVRYLVLTAEGRALVARIGSVRRGWMERHFSDWSAEDRETLLDLMDRMLDADAAPDFGSGTPDTRPPDELPRKIA